MPAKAEQRRALYRHRVLHKMCTRCAQPPAENHRECLACIEQRRALGPYYPRLSAQAAGRAACGGLLSAAPQAPRRVRAVGLPAMCRARAETSVQAAAAGRSPNLAECDSAGLSPQPDPETAA